MYYTPHSTAVQAPRSFHFASRCCMHFTNITCHISLTARTLNASHQIITPKHHTKASHQIIATRPSSNCAPPPPPSRPLMSPAQTAAQWALHVIFPPNIGLVRRQRRSSNLVIFACRKSAGNNQTTRSLRRRIKHHTKHREHRAYDNANDHRPRSHCHHHACTNLQ